MIQGADGRPKLQIDKRFLQILFIVLFIATTLIVYSLTRPHKNYDNCSQLKVDGHSYIKSSSPLYRKSLDRNNNGIACE